VQRALVAANSIADEGVNVEVIDLRTLSPWDRETVFESVRKTSRVIVAYEDSISWGYGAEIAAAIADECFAWLDAPVKRVASTDTFVGYAPQLEDAILPQVEDFTRAYREIAQY
jgi:2-oxoisovalerate dehydrogenase E1 component